MQLPGDRNDGLAAHGIAVVARRVQIIRNRRTVRDSTKTPEPAQAKRSMAENGKPNCNVAAWASAAEPARQSAP